MGFINNMKDAEWINTNLAPSLLYQGKYQDAVKIYSTFKNKPFGPDQAFKDKFLLLI